MKTGDIVRVVHPGGLFGPANAPEVMGIVVEPPNEVSVVGIFWFSGSDYNLPTYIHVEELEVVYRVHKN